MLGSTNADTVGRQDVKEAIARSQAVLKVANKYRVALWSLAGVMQDMSEVLVDLGRCKAVRVAEKTKAHGLQQDAVQHCGELHLTMSKRFREIGDCVHRELEEPLQNSIEEHAQTVTANEKRLLQMEREIQDKIKKAEVKSKKKWMRDNTQTQQAAKDHARYVAELSDLKFFNQNIIVGEEARNLRVMEGHLAKLLQSMTGSMDHCVHGAKACVEELKDSNCQKSLSSPGRPSPLDRVNTAPVLSTNLLATPSLRRGSLDSNLGEVAQADDEPIIQYNSLGRRGAKRERNASAGAALSTSSPNKSSPVSAGFPQLSLPTFTPLSGDSSPTKVFTRENFSFGAAAPKSIIKQNTNNTSNTTTDRSGTPTSTGSPRSSSEQKRRVAFPTSKPIATVQSESETPITDLLGGGATLSSLYPDIFAAESMNIASVPVIAHTAVVRNPAVYVAGGEGDAASEIGSVVGTTESLVGMIPLKKGMDLVYAIHDFTARSAKEMSLRKGDVIEVKKRHGTWIYGTKFTRRAKIPGPSTPTTPTDPSPLGSSDRFRRGPPQQQNNNTPADAKPEVGWIPMAFVAKFSAS
ncbi:uncharacterized protein EV422DRAFT_577928 [Fimicolochytrium jonesii]|uniref:uncharacterized protein n=1 Tax=Fimicolochytrium jonesii TaxID=1396493 RepID=UPI0022FE6A62|nr:uncharacterized protein EV422DRAFT_577928 [Fimicolochytrium jonesii]KAI8822254.1 hypothetical protein EV422DRAFT_577928 [Fimicolochytrium jonesii]